MPSTRPSVEDQNNNSMMKRFITLSITALLLLTACRGNRTQEFPVSGDPTYLNPVIRNDCPDPTVLDNRKRDGYFYAYSTRSRVGETVYEIPVWRSKDLVHWEMAGAAFSAETRPSWEPKGVLWAPDINYIGDKYVLYYALGVWGDHDLSASGVVVSDSPTGPFRDLGMLVSRANTGVGNSIDPNYFEDTDGRKYLYWGSLSHPTDAEAGRRSGIFVIEVTEDGLALKPGSKPVKVAGDRMEGTYVHKRDKYYYLFASEGSCCNGKNSTYHIIVGRSTSPLGPFVSQSGMSMITGKEGVYDTVILTRDAKDIFCGPGHNGEIVRDRKGHDWMPYHTYWKGNDYKGRLMNLDRVFWTQDGWPYFDKGVPSSQYPAPRF